MLAPIAGHLRSSDACTDSGSLTVVGLVSQRGADLSGDRVEWNVQRRVFLSSIELEPTGPPKGNQARVDFQWKSTCAARLVDSTQVDFLG